MSIFHHTIIHAILTGKEKHDNLKSTIITLILRVNNCIFFGKLENFFYDLRMAQCVDQVDASFLRERIGTTWKVCWKIMCPNLVCTQKAHILQNPWKIAIWLSLIRWNKGGIWWTPGEKQVSASQIVTSILNFDIMGVHQIFVEIFSVKVMRRYIYIYIYACWANHVRMF